jgi:hypothetical protein
MATTFGHVRNKGAPSRPMSGKVEEPDVEVYNMDINEITDPKLHLKLRNCAAFSHRDCETVLRGTEVEERRLQGCV